MKDRQTIILSERESKVLDLRLRHYPRSAIAQMFGVSIGRVRSIEVRAKKKINKAVVVEEVPNEKAPLG